MMTRTRAPRGTLGRSENISTLGVRSQGGQSVLDRKTAINWPAFRQNEPPLSTSRGRSKKISLHSSRQSCQTRATFGMQQFKSILTSAKIPCLGYK